MDLYKQFIAKPYSPLVIEATLVSDNLLRFRNDLVEIMYKLIMTTEHEIRNDKMQYGINRETEKISSTLLFGKTDKHELLTNEEILPQDQRRMIEQAKFVYSKYFIFYFRKGFSKTNKND